MRRGRIFIFLILIVLIGGILLVVAYTQLGNLAPQPTQAALTEVYYAAQNIPQGTKITQEMLGTFSIPPEKVADVMFTKGEEAALVGQTARFTLEQGVLITASMVGAGPVEVAGPTWAAKIPSGMVAATIPTNRLSLVGYGVQDGAHVNVNACLLFVDVDPSYQSILPNYVSNMQDVWFPPDGKQRPFISIEPFTQEQPSRQGRTEIDPTFQKPIYTIPSEAQRPRLVCQMILQDVVVLKLGNFSVTQTAASTDPKATPSAAQAQQAQQQSSPDIVTLMVSPQDSISLNYFVYTGAMLSMSLRNPNDTSRFAAESTTLTSLLTQYNISLPSKLPYAVQPRVDNLNPPGLPNDVVVKKPEQ